MFTRCTVDGAPAIVLRQGAPVLNKKFAGDPRKLEELGFELGHLTIVGVPREQRSMAYGYVVWCLTCSATQRSASPAVLESLLRRAPRPVEPVRVQLPDGTEAAVPAAPGLPAGSQTLAHGKFVLHAPLLADGVVADDVLSAHPAFAPRDQTLRAFVEMLSRLEALPDAEQLRAWARAVLHDE